MKIILKNGIDKKFYKLLSDLYNPFLSSQHLHDRFQYTVFGEGVSYPIGLVSVNKGKNTFMQIALIPDLQASGIGRIVLSELIKATKLKRIGWSCEKNNYPSLKLLCSLGGGVTENSVKQKKKKTFEGFFYSDKPVSKKLREVATSQLENAQREYKQWKQEIYMRRTAELTSLRRYLLSYVPIVDIHSHQITQESTDAEFLPEEIRQLISYPEAAPVIKFRLTMGVPDCTRNITKINDEILAFCKDRKQCLPVAILEDNTNVSAMLEKGCLLFKEHVYGQRLLKANNGGLANISSERLRRYREMAKAGVPLLVHIGPNSLDRVSFISSKVPTLKIIIAHLGSPMDGKKTFDATLKDLERLGEFSNVSFDCSAINDIKVVETAIKIISASRLLWGSDFPYETPQKSIDRLIGAFCLSIEDLVKMLSANALNLLRISET